MPVIYMQLNYVNSIVLVWISSITGQSPDRYYGRVAWQVSDYMGSVWCLCPPLEKAGKANTGCKHARCVGPFPSLKKVVVYIALFASLWWRHFKDCCLSVYLLFVLVLFITIRNQNEHKISCTSTISVIALWHHSSWIDIEKAHNTVWLLWVLITNVPSIPGEFSLINQPSIQPPCTQ